MVCDSNKKDCDAMRTEYPEREEIKVNGIETGSSSSRNPGHFGKQGAWNL